MSLSDDIKKINAEISKLSKQLGQTPPLFDAKDLKIAKGYLTGLRSDVKEINSDLKFVADSFRDSVNELSKQNTYLSQSKSALKGISSISLKLLEIKKGEVKANDEDIKKLRQKAKIRFEELQNALKSKTLKKEEAEEIQSAINAQAEFLRGSQEVLEITKAINKNIGVKTFGGLEAISKAIPGLNKFSGGFTEASDAAREMAHGLEDAARSGGKGLTKEKIKQLGLEKELGNLSGNAAAQRIKNMSATKKGMLSLKSGFKSLLPSIKKAFGPIFLLTELFSAFKSADKATGDMAKNMNMTFEEASKVRGELTFMAAKSMDTFLNTRALQESLMAVNKSLGTSVVFADAELASFTKLREQAGLTNEEIMGTYKLSLLNGQSLDDNTAQFMAQAKISAHNNKVLINDKELLKAISNTSSAIQLSLGGSARALGEALATAKSLGMTMEQLESSAEALLNFESSITNELKAELLLGRNINLERARLAALNNDYKTVAEEISREIGTSADFSNMNRIQQEAIAQAAGMTRESLAKTLMEREALVSLSEKDQGLGRETLNNLIEQYGVEGAQRKLEEEGIDNLMDQTSKQEEFTAAVEKMKEIFVAMEPTISAIFSIITGIFEVVGFILSPFTAIIAAAKSFSPILSSLLGLFTAIAVAALFTNAGLTFGVGALIAVGLAGAATMMLRKDVSSAKQVGDMGIDPNGGPIVTSPGLGSIFQGKKQDGLSMGPGMGTKPSIDGGGGESEVSRQERRQERKEQRREQRKTNSLLQEIALATKANKTVEMEDPFGSLYSA